MLLYIKFTSLALHLITFLGCEEIMILMHLTVPSGRRKMFPHSSPLRQFSISLLLPRQWWVTYPLHTNNWCFRSPAQCRPRYRLTTWNTGWIAVFMCAVTIFHLQRIRWQVEKKTVFIAHSEIEKITVCYIGSSEMELSTFFVNKGESSQN